MQILKTRTGYTKPPVSLVGQMFWREFFYTVGHATPNFEKMEGNPISKQVRFACAVLFIVCLLTDQHYYSVPGGQGTSS